jgi:NADH-quinone oxidoreductase subunit F
MNLRNSVLHKWRRLTQAGFGFAFINGYIAVFWTKLLYDGPLRQFCVPVLNCYSCPTAVFACPIGMLQHYASIHQIPYFILGFLGFVGLTTGRFACGWLCPFGLVQDLMFKIKSVKYRIPKFFSYFKYVFLIVLVLVLPYFTHKHEFSRLCPWGGISAAIPWVVWNPQNPDLDIPTVPEGSVGFHFVVKMAIVAGFLGLMVVTRRPFCYTSCPLGAILSFFNKYSLFKLEVDEECTQCDACREKCPLNMTAYETASSSNCVDCLECLACDNVSFSFNFANVKRPFATTPGAPCQNACPVGTEAWRYVAHISRGEYEEAYRVMSDTNPFPSVCARVCHHPCEDVCPVGTEDERRPIAIRALKRFITERINPADYKKLPAELPPDMVKRIAVIGAGPAGLTAAHYLSLNGHLITIFETESIPGGMLVSGIPSYRLPRNIIKNEIEQLLNKNITLKFGTAFGRDITTDGLIKGGYDAVFIATGAYKSKMLGLENENARGIIPSIEFLKAFNLHNEQLAKGQVVVIGGGNSAIDSARVAFRQSGVKSVTVLYRRSRTEMPASPEEITAAEAEGITIKTLVTPVKITAQEGIVTGFTCIQNKLGRKDASGRRIPVPIPGSEFTVELDTLIIAIGEDPALEWASSEGITVKNNIIIVTDTETLGTNRPGVFAGGDAASENHTVVNAIADGKKAAVMITRYLRGEPLKQATLHQPPSVYIAPVEPESYQKTDERVAVPLEPAVDRISNFDEVEKTLPESDALREAIRCIRCDLKFTQPHKETMAIKRKKL